MLGAGSDVRCDELDDPGSRKEFAAMKVFVLGLDGATWDILAPLMRGG